MNRAPTRRPATSRSAVTPSLRQHSTNVSTLRPVSSAQLTVKATSSTPSLRQNFSQTQRPSHTRAYSSMTSIRRQVAPSHKISVTKQLSHIMPASGASLRHMSLYNRQPKYVHHDAAVLTELAKNKVDYHALPESQKKTSQQYIAEVPPIVVYDDIAICDGDIKSGAGHPREFIQLNKTRKGEPEPCKYCGLRYIKADEHQVPLEQ